VGVGGVGGVALPGPSWLVWGPEVTQWARGERLRRTP